jgi:hypothetical protein
MRDGDGKDGSRSGSLFGKSGAELIPMLNELGEKGLEGRDRSKPSKFGAVISKAAQRRTPSDFNDSVTMLAHRGLSGFAQIGDVRKRCCRSLNQFTGALVEIRQAGAKRP